MTAITSDKRDEAEQMEAGIDPLLQSAVYISLGSAALWAYLLLRWMTFSAIEWTPFPAELALAEWPSITAYLIYGGLLGVDLVVGVGLLREMSWARWLGVARATFVIVASIAYFYLTREFYGAVIILAIAGMLLVLELRNTAWSVAYPAAFWLAVFFVLPMIIVFIVSLGERTRLGTVMYPPLSLNLGVYFDDYGRFFSKINGDYIYLRIFWRSVGLATLNTVICLIFGYPFAYWIARQPARHRGTLIFLVMIPFWTNFLVRTYAWMLILRDSGIINNFWTITLHDLALQA
ncbi:MAG: hypothetical protein GY805_01450, partial [Chloroflexi bacterium]|nr:hypothetical protein [Chloroflexota bacterium]